MICFAGKTVNIKVNINYMIKGGNNRLLAENWAVSHKPLVF